MTAPSTAAGDRITIRVRAKTGSETYRLLTLSPDCSAVECDCGGFDGTICSHIDACLIAGERYMVHFEDHAQADAVMNLVAPWIRIPDHWAGSWRRNLSWRGLSAPRPRRGAPRDDSRPRVTFTGSFPGKSRSAMTLEAESHGWLVLGAPSPHLDVLVTQDPTSDSRKLVAARKNGTPIVNSDEWAEVMVLGVLPYDDEASGHSVRAP